MYFLQGDVVANAERQVNVVSPLRRINHLPTTCQHNLCQEIGRLCQLLNCETAGGRARDGREEKLTTLIFFILPINIFVILALLWCPSLFFPFSLSLCPCSSQQSQTFGTSLNSIPMSDLLFLLHFTMCDFMYLFIIQHFNVHTAVI